MTVARFKPAELKNDRESSNKYFSQERNYKTISILEYNILNKMKINKQLLTYGRAHLQYLKKKIQITSDHF